MNWEFDNSSPIHNQIVKKLTLWIAAGRASPGEKLPPVRELAGEAKVNPNTMQKAMSDLEDMKLVYTERTSGRYVTEDTVLLRSLKKELIRENVERFLHEMKELGLSKEEAVESIKEMRE